MLRLAETKRGTCYMFKTFSKFLSFSLKSMQTMFNEKWHAKVCAERIFVSHCCVDVYTYTDWQRLCALNVKL